MFIVRTASATSRLKLRHCIRLLVRGRETKRVQLAEGGVYGADIWPAQNVYLEAAQILEIASATFRKRLSRARTEISRFMMAKCGLANPDNPCRCRRRVNTAIQTGRIDPARLNFATSTETARTFPALLEEIRKLDNTRRAVALYRSHPQYRSGADFAAMLSNLTT